MDSVTIEEDGPLLLIGVNRPEAHNLWNLEVVWNQTALGSRDAAEGITAFLEHRAPDFEGR